MFPKELKNAVISDPDNPVVEADSGKYRGIKSDGHFIFRGITYGKAERFRKAVPPERADGITDAVVYKGVCCQIGTAIEPDNYFIPHMWYPQSEDCLHLNIWTPELHPASGKAVIVWIHGSGYDRGSAIEQYAYDGGNLASNKDTVVVSVNHRLHALGFLDLSHWNEAYADSGNLGIRDLLLALQWIRRNIAAFGGDPDKVTLAGQGSGADKILTIMQCPEADGLYSRVVLQSPVCLSSDRRVTREHARQMASLVLKELGLENGTPEDLESLPFYRLAKSCARAATAFREKNGFDYIWAPVADGRLFSTTVPEGGFRKEAADIPMLLGSNEGEFRSLAYTRGHPSSAHNGLDDFVRETCLSLVEQRKALSGAATYLYLFAPKLPAFGGVSAWHCAEIPFVFLNAGYMEATYEPGVTEALQESMATCWTDFARSGNPSPSWPPVEQDGLSAEFLQDGFALVRAEASSFRPELPEGIGLEDRSVYGGSLIVADPLEKKGKR